MEEAIDALGSDLSIRLSRREESPRRQPRTRGQRLVPVPLWQRRNWRSTWRCATSKSTTPSWRAALGSTSDVVRRMLDPEHASKAEKIQAALRLWASSLTVEVRDAA